ncbi:uncharacterized protein LOC128882499 [Hylaeus volcanicus]|uniref:uncharacterized protein LOC128882499 n=1 Tax=Hylaeus volcanicus TaxID=313075 RepID=UPI0023B7B266|nr:uncharacterized protein LOC128882499 [Hylaeus volcanicus]
MPPVRILQANLNNSARAQDLFVHCLAELGVGLAVAAEPYRVADRPNWVADALGSVVIVGGDTAALRVFACGDGFVGAECGGLALIGVYAPPSAPLAAFEWLLDGVRDALSRSPVARTLGLGDFNAKSTAWGGPATDARGRTLLEWQRKLIVDLSWSTPAAARLVSGWRVAEEVESLSDHLYILMDVSAAPQYHPARGPARGRPPRRWALKRLENDALMAAALAASWPDAPAGPVADVDREADWFRESLTAACDAAMPRARKLPRRAAYWRSDEIAALRATCSAARSCFTRARRRWNRDPARAAVLYEVYREATGQATWWPAVVGGTCCAACSGIWPSGSRAGIARSPTRRQPSWRGSSPLIFRRRHTATCIGVCKISAGTGAIRRTRRSKPTGAKGGSWPAKSGGASSWRAAPPERRR